MHAVALDFLEHEQVPETKRHLKLRTLLFELLELAFADRGAIGSDQFVYWDAADPRVEQPGLGTTLRLAYDAAGTSLYPTLGEAAQQRVRELEAELARLNVL